MYKYILISISLLFSISCQRPQADGSIVSIQVPTAQEFAKANKSQAQAASVVDYSRLCFAVSVKGPGIALLSGSTCEVERGTVGGSVGPGDQLSLEVLSGSDRTFEIYGFLRNSVNESCPTLTSAIASSWPIQKIYFLGSKADVTVTPPETTLNISITLPSESQNLAVAQSWPAVCTATGVASQGRIGNLVLGANTLNSSSYRLRAHVAERNLEPELAGANFKFTGKVR